MAPKKKQIPAPPLRRAEPALLADFDEQLWPVNLLLVLFAVCVAAAIVANSDFASLRLLANGWCHLGILAAIVSALAWGVARLDRRVQRRMQLGVFLSLLLHLWLCLLSCNIYLSAIARRDRDAPEAFEEPAPVTLPDYHWQDQSIDDASDPTLETPVETPPLETEQEVERAEPVEEPKPRPVEPEPEPRPMQPTTAPIERSEMSAPRRADELAGARLSRQELRLAETNEQASLPKIAEAQEKTLESPVQVERSAARLEANRPSTETALPTSLPSEQSLARRPPTEVTPMSAAMNLPRTQTAAKDNEPVAPAADRVVETPSVTRLQPVTREIDRAETTVRLSRRAQPVRESPSISASATAPSAPRANAAEQPRIDARANSKLAKAEVHVQASQSTIASLPAPAAVRDSNDLSETRMEQVRRATSALPDTSASSTTGAESSSETAPSAVLSSNVEPAARPASDQPSIASAIPTAASRRSAAAVSSESAAAEVSAPSAAAPSNSQSVQPALAAISKASGGAVGLTRQQNFDTEMPGISSTAVARSAARRFESVQSMDAGLAAAPSTPAKIAKTRAAADVPAANMSAEEVTVADVAGSVRPAEVEASASAASERLAAALPRTNRTAAAGAGAIDQGAPQVTSAIGERRASGGGEPSLARGATSVNVAKATAPADAGSAATQVAAVMVGAEGGAKTPAEPAPAVDAVGRSAASSLPTPSGISSDTAPEGAVQPTLAATVESRRADPAPALATGLPSAAGRSRGQAAVTDDVEFDAPPEMPLASSGARGEGGAEPPSASDFVRNSPAALPGTATPTEVDDGAFALHSVAAGPQAPQRANESPSISVGDGSQLVPGRQPTVASAAEIADIAGQHDAGGGAVPAAAEGQRLAMADLGEERQAAGLPVLTRAPLATGGLGAGPSMQIGVPSRLARPESDVAHLDTGRMILRRSGGAQAAEVRVQDVAVPGYRQRDRQLREELARQRGGSEGSEKAVEMGLDFLARHQNVDGSWSLQKFSQGRPGYENAGDGQMVSDTAATGLAMLAFLGAGYTHTDGKYRLVAARGLNYLLGNQRPEGDLFLPQEAASNLNVWLYSHGIASIALCEAYGMTRDPELRQPAQRALDFIVAAQHPTEGGWRYSPRQGSDTSVSGWQLMALKSGELSGLRVPSATYAKVNHWLDGAQAPVERVKYVYRPKSAKTHQNTASRVMTAEALLMRQYLGWRRDHRLMTAGADYLIEQLPDWSIKPDWQRDSYYWYYGTQVMFQMGGPHWDAWNERLRPLLIEKQVQSGPLAGSWEPLGDVPDRWGREGGRIYVTAMHLLMLEVYYRHLPLYRSLEE